VIDRFEHARSLGARITSADTVETLVETVGEWGLDAAVLTHTLDAYAGPNTLREPPFWAVEFQPTITFSLGGLRVDAHGRVLDRDGAAIGGLYAAGGDAGGLQGPHYVAGLMLGMVFGPRAVEAVKEEIHGR
jgi:predicted oxidoreductase